MGLAMVEILEKLGVNIDISSPPIMPPNLINWIGRVYDVSPREASLGLIEGMDIWTSGKGFAPLDLASIESWMFDVPRGNHLVIAERRLSFENKNLPTRDGRTLILWELDDVASFVGHAIIDGRLTLVNEKTEMIDKESTDEIFTGSGPFTLKSGNDFKNIEDAGLEVSSSKPILLEAQLHNVRGKLSGPEIIDVENWVLNCNGLFVIKEVSVLEKSLFLNKEQAIVIDFPNFAELLSERRPHSEGMGDLLHWYRFEEESQIVETYNVLVPAYKGIDALGRTWIFDSVSNNIHTHQNTKAS